MKVGVLVSIGITEAEEAGLCTTHRTAPIVASGTEIEERTITIPAAARLG